MSGYKYFSLFFYVILSDSLIVCLYISQLVSKLLVCLPNSLSFSNHMTLPNFHHHCYGVISELGHISTFCNSPNFAWIYVSFLAPYIKDIKEETGQSLATQPLNLFWVNTMFSISYHFASILGISFKAKKKFFFLAIVSFL